MLQELDNEYRLLRNTEIGLVDDNDIEGFWNKVEDISYADNKKMFPTLTTFVFNVLSLPHSSANVERVFSNVNLLKTQQRNKLATASISGTLHAKNFISLQGKHCFSVEFNKNILSLHNQQIYKKSTELFDSE